MKIFHFVLSVVFVFFHESSRHLWDTILLFISFNSIHSNPIQSTIEMELLPLIPLCFYSSHGADWWVLCWKHLKKAASYYLESVSTWLSIICPQYSQRGAFMVHLEMEIILHRKRTISRKENTNNAQRENCFWRQAKKTRLDKGWLRTWSHG